MNKVLKSFYLNSDGLDILKDKHPEAKDVDANHLMKYDKVPILKEQCLNKEDGQGSDLTKNTVSSINCSLRI